MQRIHKWAGVALALSLFIVAGVATYFGHQAWLSHEQTKFHAYLALPIALTATTEVTINPGASLAQATQSLAQVGVIEAAPFAAAITRLGHERKIQAGHYRFAPGDTHQQAIDKLINGKVYRQKFRLIEGTTFATVLANLGVAENLKHTIANLPAPKVWQLLAPGDKVGPEGMLLPDTYLYSRGDSDIDILTTASKHLQKLLARLWLQRNADTPLNSPYEALILASIIEKETGQSGERPLIASVFVNRLRKGMRLQSDPTVIYGMGNKFNGNLRKVDLQTDTPYNTYTRAGLPPTPIAMVSKAALHAALQPAESNFLYFVATGKGAHQFSKTLREHINAVNRYQKKRTNEH